MLAISERIKQKLLDDAKLNADNLLNAKISALLIQRLSGDDAGHRHRIAAQVQLLELEQHFLVAHAATLAAQQHATQQQADAEGDKVRGPTSTHQQQLTQPPQLDEQNDGRQAEVVKRARSPALEGAVCAEVGGDALHPEKRMRSGGHVTLQQQQQQLESAPQEVRRTSIPQNHELAIPSNCQPQQQQQQQQQSSQQPQSSQHTAAAPQKEAKRTSTAKNQELARHNRERQALVQQQGKEKKAMQRQHVQELRALHPQSPQWLMVRQRHRQEAFRLGEQHRLQQLQQTRQHKQETYERLQQHLRERDEKRRLEQQQQQQQQQGSGGGVDPDNHSQNRSPIRFMPPSRPGSVDQHERAAAGPPGPPQGPSMPSILPTVPSAPPPPSLTASATIPAPPLGLQTPIGVGVGGDPLLAPAGGGVVAAGQSQAPLMSDPMGLGAAMGAPVAGIQPAAPFQGPVSSVPSFTPHMALLVNPELQLLQEQHLRLQQEKQLAMEQLTLVQTELQLVSVFLRQQQQQQQQQLWSAPQHTEIQAMMVKQQALMLKQQQQQQLILQLHEMQAQGELQVLLMQQQQQQQRQQQQQQQALAPAHLLGQRGQPVQLPHRLHSVTQAQHLVQQQPGTGGLLPGGLLAGRNSPMAQLNVCSPQDFQWLQQQQQQQQRLLKQQQVQPQTKMGLKKAMQAERLSKMQRLQARLDQELEQLQQRHAAEQQQQQQQQGQVSDDAVAEGNGGLQEEQVQQEQEQREQREQALRELLEAHAGVRQHLEVQGQGGGRDGGADVEEDEVPGMQGLPSVGLLPGEGGDDEEVLGEGTGLEGEPGQQEEQEGGSGDRPQDGSEGQQAGLDGDVHQRDQNSVDHEGQAQSRGEQKRPHHQGQQQLQHGNEEERVDDGDDDGQEEHQSGHLLEQEEGGQRAGQQGADSPLHQQLLQYAQEDTQDKELDSETEPHDPNSKPQGAVGTLPDTYHQDAEALTTVDRCASGSLDLNAASMGAAGLGSLPDQWEGLNGDGDNCALQLRDMPPLDALTTKTPKLLATGDEQFLYPLLPKTAKQKAEEERKKAGEQQQKAEEQQQVAEEQQLRALLRRQEIKEARELQAAEAARGRQVIADREAQLQDQLDSLTWRSDLQHGPFTEKDVMSEAAIMEVLRRAPTWVAVMDFAPPPFPTSKKKKKKQQQSHIKMVVLTAPQLLKLHRDAARKGCGALQVQTLVAGIDGNLARVQARMAAHGGAPCQACDLRPLALLTTAAHCGMPYSPLRLIGKVNKLPTPPSDGFLPWAVPACLFSRASHPPSEPGHHWHSQLTAREHQGCASGPRSGSSGSSRSARAGSAALAAGGGCVLSHAEQFRVLLLGVPFWNVVERYNSQGGWKCYRGHSVPGSEVLSLLEQGLLDKMVPVLGIQQPLHPRMWLPSSLFLPLDALRNSCFTPIPGPEPIYFRYTPLSAKQLEDINRDNRLLFD